MEDLSIDQQVNLKAVTPPFWIVDNYDSILYRGFWIFLSVELGFRIPVIRAIRIEL